MRVVVPAGSVARSEKVAPFKERSTTKAVSLEELSFQRMEIRLLKRWTSTNPDGAAGGDPAVVAEALADQAEGPAPLKDRTR